MELFCLFVSLTNRYFQKHADISPSSGLFCSGKRAVFCGWLLPIHRLTASFLPCISLSTKPFCPERNYYELFRMQGRGNEQWAELSKSAWSSRDSPTIPGREQGRRGTGGSLSPRQCAPPWGWGWTEARMSAHGWGFIKRQPGSYNPGIPDIY